MVYSSWIEAARELERLIIEATDEQIETADQLGVSLPKGLPWIVAGARLQVALAHQLAIDPRPAPTDAQLTVLEELAVERMATVPHPATRIEADAWIRYLYLDRRVEALKGLQPVAGDIVRNILDSEDKLYEVVSVGEDGRVHFRGGGARAWPDRLARVAAAADASPEADDYRQAARNRAALSEVERGWSLARHTALKQYNATDDVVWHELEQLQDVIDRATDERAIQDHLQIHPHILVSLVRGPERYIIPKARVGLSYVTDFVMADIDSLGVRWTLVELESPASAVVLQKKNELDRFARAGVSQVREWREWLQTNIANARTAVSEGGLGLYEIRPQADALVLVGRRALLSPRSKAIRAHLYENERILVHTYDWLVEQLQGAIRFNGPPGLNPFLLQRPTSLDPHPWL